MMSFESYHHLHTFLVDFWQPLFRNQWKGRLRTGAKTLYLYTFPSQEKTSRRDRNAPSVRRQDRIELLARNRTIPFGKLT